MPCQLFYILSYETNPFLQLKYKKNEKLLPCDQEELKEWDQCLLMLGDAKVDEHGNISHTKDCNLMYLDKDGEDREINVSFL